jgi:hypothetical protein
VIDVSIETRSSRGYFLDTMSLKCDIGTIKSAVKSRLGGS